MLPKHCTVLASRALFASRSLQQGQFFQSSHTRRLRNISGQVKPLSCTLRGMSSAASRDSMVRGLVSCEWLNSELSKGVKDLRVIDASWYLPNSPFAAPEGSQGAQADFDAGPRLPGAVFFDIDAVATAHANGVPHMLPTPEIFAAAMAALGVERETRVVVYDRHGIFSAPRLWYTLKVAFGHPSDVAVLDGGLPRWTALGYPLEQGAAPLPPPPAPMSSWEINATAVWSVEKIQANIQSKEALMVDVRPAGRFLGTVPEPRPGMRGGHVPGSVNVPFVDLLTPPERTMKAPEEIQERLQAAGVSIPDLAADEGGFVVTSCGSGLTSCILGLAMHQLGLPNSKWAVYDGSWAEWGARKDTPIVRQSADGSTEVVP